MVPVRILNPKTFSIKVKKGEIVGKCVPIEALSTIIETIRATPVATVQSIKIKNKILSLCNLDQEQLILEEKLIGEYADIFATQDGEYGGTYSTYKASFIGEVKRSCRYGVEDES